MEHFISSASNCKVMLNKCSSQSIKICGYKIAHSWQTEYSLLTHRFMTSLEIPWVTTKPINYAISSVIVTLQLHALSQHSISCEWISNISRLPFQLQNPSGNISRSPFCCTFQTQRFKKSPPSWPGLGEPEERTLPINLLPHKCSSSPHPHLPNNLKPFQCQFLRFYVWGFLQYLVLCIVWDSPPQAFSL